MLKLCSSCLNSLKVIATHFPFIFLKIFQAYKILTEGLDRQALTEDLRASGNQEDRDSKKEVKKPKRRPRLTLNEF